ncbi:FAD-dependent oxidoreductase [Paramicrobacterium agarici]|uniref:2-polyprenyl-6-methoxyphenol hydroxylase-like FAD-dependent oxidoreductase n=1 Tax=Paramicrobacterium agarici TaxID=630514 RepID=A0A2A9DYM3_9MICO|nr:NAD(P)/FAD-dependent oxidoreductase [Microbacterium agarici]PFG31703.1 2-polyprenyl-6-methoxyphenol hydroxylase-like FAD-dependent oxidoreductase [Microbacterium agarici]
MFIPTPLSEQLRASADDPLRVLIVGAGIAGTTAAQLHRARGLEPVLVDRVSSFDNAGYMLALMPMVDAAIDDLGVRDAYVQASTHIDRYRVLDHHGSTLREDSLGAILSDFGDYRGISRAALLDVLTTSGAPVSLETTVRSLSDGTESAHVRFDSPDGPNEATFDAVIIADGIHSHTRRFVPGGAKPSETITGWGGWVVWTDADADTDLGEEMWGNGFFVGSYPVAGAVGAFIGGPRDDTAVGPVAFVDSIRSRLTSHTPRLERVLDAVTAAEDPFYWVLDDVRARPWASGRTVLLGDAAAGFLPTAGIGAGMAMESAWVLTGVLADAVSTDVGAALTAYEAEQRPRVESAQSNSRQLARLMFRRSTLLAHVRNIAMRLMTIEAALGPIKKLLQKPARIPEVTAVVD